MANPTADKFFSSFEHLSFAIFWLPAIRDSVDNIVYLSQL